ncbi:MAG: hypothetical protein ACP5QU_03000 [Anaerolineae bacterium]
MTTLEQDRQFLLVSIPELQAYLLSKELYYPISARGVDLPRLTLGGVLLALSRLRGANQAADLEGAVEVIRLKWRSAWEAKASREVRARFALWQNYLADVWQNPDQHAPYYRQEVRVRAMLDLLLAELSREVPEATWLRELDERLRRMLIPGEFVWETAVQAAFPAEKFWYLYGTLKA